MQALKEGITVINLLRRENHVATLRRDFHVAKCFIYLFQSRSTDRQYFYVRIKIVLLQPSSPYSIPPLTIFFFIKFLLLQYKISSISINSCFKVNSIQFYLYFVNNFLFIVLLDVIFFKFFFE